MRTLTLSVAVVVAIGVGASCSSGTSKKASTTTTTVVAPAGSTAPGPTTGSAPASGEAAWATYDGDAARSGVSNDGPADPAKMRRQWGSPTLDGDIYAQPLVVGRRVFVATENDTVYAIDASSGAIAWQRHLGEPVANSSLPCGNVDPVGITSTPVIDTRANRLYVVGLVQPAKHMMFQLDATSGAVLSSIAVDAPGADPKVQNQRSALTLSNDTVYVPFGGRFGDCGEYHGRVVAVKVTNRALGAVNAYTLPTQGRGGLWTPPGAVAAADGSLFFASGNSASSTSYDFGNSVVHLGADLHVVDSWAPKNWAKLNASDTDIGSTSPVLVGGNRVFEIGKAGVGYLLDAAHLGGIGGELHSGDVCRGSAAFGSVVHDGNTLYVPCTDGIVQVMVHGDTFDVGWKTRAATPGPPIVASGAVWMVTTKTGTLIAVDQASGRVVATQPVGDLPSRFSTVGVGDHRIVVVAARKVTAFGD